MQGCKIPTVNGSSTYLLILSHQCSFHSDPGAVTLPLHPDTPLRKHTLQPLRKHAQNSPQGTWGTQGWNQLPAQAKGPPTRHNITREEFKAIKEQREDQSRVVLTVNKGVAMVIMDKQQYTDMATVLLNDTNTYRTIPKDPTTKLKNKLIGKLKDIKQTGGSKDST